jgi:proteasome accessory factor B
MHFETHRTDDGIVEVNYLDLDLLAEEILEFGDSVEILGPDSLKQKVRVLLKRVIEAHA